MRQFLDWPAKAEIQPVYSLCIDAPHLGSDIDFTCLPWVPRISFTQGHGTTAGFCSLGADLHQMPVQSQAQHSAEVQDDVRDDFAIRVIQVVKACGQSRYS